MVTRASLRGLWVFVATGSLASLAALACLACEGVNDGPETLDGKPTSDGGPALSAAFSRQCSRCHGHRGEGTYLSYPRLPGALDEATFIATVRSGRRDMPAFDPSLIGDSDLKADYAVLKVLNK